MGQDGSMDSAVGMDLSQHVLCAMHPLNNPLNPDTTLWGKYCYHPHLIYGKTEVTRSKHRIKTQLTLKFILLNLVVANTETATGARRLNEMIQRSLRSGPLGNAGCDRAKLTTACYSL